MNSYQFLVENCETFLEGNMSSVIMSWIRMFSRRVIWNWHNNLVIVLKDFCDRALTLYGKEEVATFDDIETWWRWLLFREVPIIGFNCLFISIFYFYDYNKHYLFFIFYYESFYRNLCFWRKVLVMGFFGKVLVRGMSNKSKGNFWYRK